MSSGELASPDYVEFVRSRVSLSSSDVRPQTPALLITRRTTLTLAPLTSPQEITCPPLGILQRLAGRRTLKADWRGSVLIGECTSDTEGMCTEMPFQSACRRHLHVFECLNGVTMVAGAVTVLPSRDPSGMGFRRRSEAVDHQFGVGRTACLGWHDGSRGEVGTALSVGAHLSFTGEASAKFAFWIPGAAGAWKAPSRDSPPWSPSRLYAGPPRSARVDLSVCGSRWKGGAYLTVRIVRLHILEHITGEDSRNTCAGQHLLTSIQDSPDGTAYGHSIPPMASWGWCSEGTPKLPHPGRVHHRLGRRGQASSYRSVRPDILFSFGTRAGGFGSFCLSR